jgi:tRNA(Arg) A34 adenosine deaminase TadA
MEEADRTHMQAAIALAIASKHQGDVPFGAVVVQDGQIIAYGLNGEHTRQDVTCHAEMNAVSAASRYLGRRDLSDCTIYSTAEPCPMCAGAIFHSCIKRVVFAMSRDDLPHLFRTRNIRLWDLAADWHYKPEVVGGVLKEQAIDVFLEYKQAFRVTPGSDKDAPVAPSQLIAA